MIEPKRNHRRAITAAVMLDANRHFQGNAGGLMCKILGQPVRRIVLQLGWGWQERSLQGEYVCFSYLGNYCFENCLQKRGIPTAKPPSLSSVLKTLLRTPRFPLQFHFWCFVFSPSLPRLLTFHCCALLVGYLVSIKDL